MMRAKQAVAQSNKLGRFVSFQGARSASIFVVGALARARDEHHVDTKDGAAFLKSKQYANNKSWCLFCSNVPEMYERTYLGSVDR